MIGLRSKRVISDVVIYLILLVMVFVWLFPLVWMVLKAFDTNTGVSSVGIFPETYTLNNFKLLFQDSNNPYGRWLINTLVIALISCAITTMFILMVSFALSRMRFSARKKLMNIGLILGLFPGFLSMIALYYVFSQFNLTNNIFGLALAYSLASGTGYYIVKGFFDTIPMAIDEAARIDGATKNRIFWQMIIPLSKPIIIYTVLTSFISPWCDFIMASVFLSSPKNFTIAVGIRNWTTQTMIADYFARFCAGSVLISIPIVIMFLIMQKFYIAGITGGAAKG